MSEPRPTFTFHAGWGALSTQQADAVVEFWLKEKALPSEQAARHRVDQVVMYATASDGDIAAVCTAQPVNPPQIGQPLYFYRSFVAPAWRKSMVVYRLLKEAVGLLEDDAREHDWPCIGVLLELENERFSKKGRMPVWPGIDFVYVGKSPRGLECRIHWFRSARLK